MTPATTRFRRRLTRITGGRWMLGLALIFGTLAIAQTPSAEKLDINTATAADLAHLPGMGKEYARRVIAGRPYRAKNQLSLRGVLPDEEYRRIAPLIVARRAPAAPPK